MKKLSTLLITCMMFLSSISVAYADPAYDIGRSIGNAIGNAIGSAPYKGDIDKSFYKDENFNFSYLNKFLVIAYIVPETANYVSDPYIANKYPVELKKRIGDKYIVKTMSDVAMQYITIHPDAAKLPQEQIVDNLIQYAKNSSDAIITANIYAYYATGNTNNVLVDFCITPVGWSNPVFSYKESRLNVERGNKEHTLDIITEHFIEKFKDTFHKKGE